MKEEMPVNFIEPKYRFRIPQLNDRGEAIKSRTIEEGQKSYRLKLVSCNTASPNKEKSVSHSALSLRKIVNHTDLKDKITALRGDIKKIETEFKEEHQKRNKISNIKVIKTIPSEVEIIPQQRIVLKPVWERQHVSGKITKKRLKKIQTSRIYNYEQEIQPQHFPIVERYKQLKRQYINNPHSPYSNHYSVLNNRSQLTIINKYRQNHKKLKIRRVFNAILFTIYLKKYNYRMREQRKKYFTINLRPQVESELLQIKKLIIKSSQPFFDALIISDLSKGLLKSEDDKSLRQKTRTIKRLVSLEIECFRLFVRQIATIGNHVKILYYICKHGNYSCLNNINSPEELSLTCISQAYGYMSGDRYLEQSAILSLIFLKLLLYNVFLQPQTLPFPSITPLQCKFIQLSGNILYELFIDVQDELLQASSAVYMIGNWKRLSHRFFFKPAQSMTVEGVHRREKEVIDGLADHKYIRSVYGTKDMYQNRGIIRQCLQELQQMIAKFHYQVREKCF